MAPPPLPPLVSLPGRVLDRQELLKEVWGYRPGVVSRAVDHAVKRLRIKVERDRRRPEHIVTVTGRGYRFELPPQPPERAPVPSEPEGAPSRGNLTASLDAFVGRTAALDWLSAEASSHTICGIVGPPGGGKSRLAAHWAWSQRQAAPGGVWRISLAGTADLEGLLQGLATLLGFELGPGGPEEAQGQVGERLQGLGRAVLLFDDADLVLSTLGSCMEDWSRGAPELLFLFTAREEPQLAGASVLRLAAMEPTEAVELPFRPELRMILDVDWAALLTTPWGGVFFSILASPRHNPRKKSLSLICNLFHVAFFTSGQPYGSIWAISFYTFI